MITVPYDYPSKSNPRPCLIKPVGMEPVKDGDSLRLEAKVELKDSLAASKCLF